MFFQTSKEADLFLRFDDTNEISDCEIVKADIIDRSTQLFKSDSSDGE